MSDNKLVWFENTPGVVAGRHVFYNNSFFDGNNPGIDAADDAAIDPTKSAYLPGSGPAQINNITNYTRGINGIVIDLAGGGAHTAITANDFIFKIGANNSPETWTAAPLPAAISVRPGAGENGSDRIVITWADNAIQNTYLEAQVLATDRTGLAAPDVFYFGNLVGETASVTPAGNFARTAAADGGAILAGGSHLNVGIANRFDIDKSNSVTVANDRGPILAAGTGQLARLNLGIADLAASHVAVVSSNLSDDAAQAIAIALTAPVSARLPVDTQPDAVAPIEYDVSQRTPRRPPTITEPLLREAAGRIVFSKQSADGDFLDEQIELDAQLLEELAAGIHGCCRRFECCSRRALHARQTGRAAHLQRQVH